MKHSAQFDAAEMWDRKRSWDGGTSAAATVAPRTTEPGDVPSQFFEDDYASQHSDSSTDFASLRGKHYLDVPTAFLIHFRSLA